MLQNLLLTNLFLVANSLITVSFILYSFLYLDLYFNSKKKYALLVGWGGTFIALSFATALLVEITDMTILKEYFILPLQFLGLLLVAIGYGQEIVPTLSNTKKTTKVNSTILPLAVSSLFLANFLLSAFITSKNLFKVQYGKSNEFKPLSTFWFLITIIFFLNLVAFISNNRFPVIEIALSRYSLIWVLLQISLLVAFLLMYKWIRLFFSFRNFTKVLFDIWSFSIILCVLVTSLFLAINVRTYEKEVTQVLRNNGGMVEYSIKQVKESNGDVLRSIASSKEILLAAAKKDTPSLQQQLRFVATENLNLDQVLLVDSDGRVLYSSDSPSLVGDIVADNSLINVVLSEKSIKDEYFIQRKGTITQQLVYQTVVPLFSQNQFLGAVVGSKNLGYVFLNNLNSYTGQEILLLDESSTVLASVLNGGLKSNIIGLDDTVRIENLKYLDEESSVFLEINNSAYLGSIIGINDSSEKEIAKLMVLNSYDIVANTARNSMYVTSFYSLIISMLAFIPSYFLARRIERDNA